MELVWEGQYLALVLVAVQSSGQQGNRSQGFGWEGVQLFGGAGRHLEVDVSCSTLGSR